MKNENVVLHANVAEYEYIFELNKKPDEENWWLQNPKTFEEWKK